MPLIFQKEHDEFDCRLAVWKKTEADSKLYEALDLSPGQSHFLDSLNEKNKKEWLCSRHLVKELIPEEKYKLYKDNFGKPFLVNSPWFISISHSNGLAAVIIAKTLVGIDIQFEEEKLQRLYPKFISEQEISKLDASHLLPSYHVFWGGKEAMYKAYGKKELDFRRHMHIYPFRYFRPDLELAGWVQKNNVRQDYDLYTEKLDNFYLVYAILEG